MSVETKTNINLGLDLNRDPREQKETLKNALSSEPGSQEQIALINNAINGVELAVKANEVLVSDNWEVWEYIRALSDDKKTELNDFFASFFDVNKVSVA